MSDTVIRVENLSKKYVLSHQQEGSSRYKSLRESISNRVSSLSKKLVKSSGKEIYNPAREEFWALKDVSFEIKQGDRIGIIGRNGAGKSTLLKILSRITEPSSGCISIKGRVASLLEVGTGFHPELTGRENIYLNGAILGMSKAEIKRKFDEIVTFAEVEKFLDTPVKRYSSGMYVRLAFAVAAHLEPEILIVDEVLAVGDAQFQKKCLGKMEQVGQEGRTVIFVSHNMTAVKNLCTCTLLLNQGKNIMLADPDKVINTYLQTETLNVLERTFDDINKAPGNEYTRIKSIRILPDIATPYDDITTKTAITIECEFWTLIDSIYVNLSLSLDNIQGECIFATASPSLKLNKGIHTKLCYIPENLLNDGIYTISMMVVKDESVCLYKLENAVSFEVRDERDIKGWHGKWPGTVRPMLYWKMKNTVPF
ncbi:MULTISPECIES: ABC transporter ATP-binding protein [unclassified Nostoc]|uniref:ABC transporter ATP-binding protein n=1 Tax=unclassified Nostoc TaxID=2593658 RepID=UPI002AD57A79|nr:ABC transporter ATP-binding protein [Nostoc sp. DedQUE03]MDZ7973521.1 ABC transporter ATP-binding protein [Nostoc sp. DedQUE03]MDZ8047240.1 ABC transporter ATP-binding protein [Nostoc sp. DedQUE02]